MELYRRTAPKVKFYLPTSDTSGVSATWSLDGISKGVLSVSAPSNGAVEVQLPFLQYDGQVAIDWTFVVPGSGSVTDRVYYDVVTPILTKEEVTAIYDPQPLSDAEYVKSEAAVRHIINAHCGQTFGKYIGTWSVAGDASNSLALPARLLEVLNVNGDEATNYTILGDGFNLRHYPYGEPVNIKADVGTLQNSGVIYDPYVISRERYAKSVTYSIYGIWGYNSVPNTVKEAAKLLVNDYACADAAYRDRYLTSMTAADWRIQFNAGAFINTGNVRADQLLEPYVLRRGWAVL
jgi:hypothetical protein